MKYPDFIEQLIIEKEYLQLTLTEKEQIGEWVDNEAQYTAIRQLLAGIDAVAGREKQLIPAAGIKTNLQAAFNKKHGKQRGLKYSRNWAIGISVAASIVLVAVSVWVFNRDEEQVTDSANVPQIEKPDVIVKNQPQITAKTETVAPPMVGTTAPPILPPNNSNVPVPEATNNANSIAVATYPDLNELMITVF